MKTFNFKSGKAYKFLKFIGRKGLFWFAVSMVSGVLIAGVELGLSASLALMIKSLGISTEVPQLPFGLKNFDPSPNVFLMILVFFGVSKSILTFLVQQSGLFANEVVALRLRVMLLNQYFNSKKFIGSYADFNNYITEYFFKGSAFCNYLVLLVPVVIQAMLLFAVLVSRNLQLTAFGLAGVLVVAGIVHLISLKTVSLAEKIPPIYAAWSRRLLRSLRNWTLLNSLRMVDAEKKQLMANIYTRTSISVRSAFYNNLNSVAPSLFGVLIAAGLIAMHMHSPILSGVDFFAYLYIFLKLVQSLATIATYYSTLASNYPQFRVAVKFFFSFNGEEISNALENSSVLKISGGNWESIGESFYKKQKASQLISWGERVLPDLKINNLHYQYDHGKEVISGLNLEVIAGKSIAIVGKSGSGKSTLLSLILGNLEPTKGEILIGGQKPDAYFNEHPFTVGYVGADPYLMEGTIRENILYGNPHQVTDEDIKEAMDFAHLTDWLKSTPKGLEYELNENADGLSSGQKQRLAIARALLLKPAMLILDEISANLDHKTEEDLAETLVKLEGKVTIIIVSHREALVKHISNRLELKP